MPQRVSELSDDAEIRDKINPPQHTLLPYEYYYRGQRQDKFLPPSFFLTFLTLCLKAAAMNKHFSPLKKVIETHKHIHNGPFNFQTSYFYPPKLGVIFSFKGGYLPRRVNIHRFCCCRVVTSFIFHIRGESICLNEGKQQQQQEFVLIPRR